MNESSSGLLVFESSSSIMPLPQSIVLSYDWLMRRQARSEFFFF